MKKILFHLSTLALVLSLSSPAWAIEEVIKYYRGIRSLGMGGVVTTTGMYDEALFGNPATQCEDEVWKVSILNVTAEINTNIIAGYKTIKSATSAQGGDVLVKVADLMGKNQHLRTSVLPGVFIPRFGGGNTAIAFGLLGNVQTNLALRSNIDIDFQTVIDIGPNVGVGRKFFDEKLDLGVNVHAIYRVASDKQLSAATFLGGAKPSISTLAGQGLGVDADFGAYFKFPFKFFGIRPNIGGSVNNIFKTDYSLLGKRKIIKKIEGSVPTNERLFNAGLRFDFPELSWILTGNVLALEIQDIGAKAKHVSLWKKTHLGAEIRLVKLILLRGGIHQGYFAGGLGLDLPLLKLDVATYAEELGANVGQWQDRRYVARVSFDI